MRAAVVVMGDLGRSPRMLYHALALAADGVSVDLVGCLDSRLPSSVADHPLIATHHVGRGHERVDSRAMAGRFFLAGAGWRALCQATALVRLLLWRVPRPDVILVQNPPAIPALIVALAAARLRAARLVVDWHNLTSAMLGLRLGPEHPVVRAVHGVEGALGRRADGHLFVSQAMARSLAERWGLEGAVFRDHPAERFEPVAADARTRIRRALLARLGCDESEGRMALIVGPTSWSSDEDHDRLVEALPRLDAIAATTSVVPVVLLTGRGPTRARFEAAVASQSLARVRVYTCWFEADEYPDVLAVADIGLCLHRSASGLDLPMKVADLFGAGVPVCALDYGPCLSEIVRHGENGLLVRQADELAEALGAVTRALASGDDLLARLRRGVERSRTVRWGDAWRAEARQVLLPGSAR